MSPQRDLHRNLEYVVEKVFRHPRVGSNPPVIHKKGGKRPEKLRKLEQIYVNEKKALKARYHGGKNVMKQGVPIIENKGKHIQMKGNRVVI